MNKKYTHTLGSCNTCNMHMLKWDYVNNDVHMYLIDIKIYSNLLPMESVTSSCRGGTDVDPDYTMIVMTTLTPKVTADLMYPS